MPSLADGYRVCSLLPRWGGRRYTVGRNLASKNTHSQVDSHCQFKHSCQRLNILLPVLYGVLSALWIHREGWMWW